MIYSRQRFPGSTYLVVLGAATIVSIFGMMALTQQRIQRRGFEDSADVHQARLNAQSAIRLGLLAIDLDSNWRTTLFDVATQADVNIGYGTLALVVTDPYDADLTDDDTDPVVLTGIGKAGGAVQRMEINLYPKEQPLECLKAAICCDDDMINTSGTIRADRTIYFDKTYPSSADIYADVVADQITGGTYHGATEEITDAERPDVPSVSTVDDYYLTNGTAIDINSIPSILPNSLKNYDMEDGNGDGKEIYDWEAVPAAINGGDTCVVEQSNDQVHGGSYSMFVRNRDEWTTGPIQYVTNWLKAGTSYQVEAWIYSKDNAFYSFAWYTKGTGSGILQFPSLSNYKYVAKNVWTKVSFTVTPPSWSGSLEDSLVMVFGSFLGSQPDFYVDNFTAREVVTGRFIHSQLISPNHNPFGGTTNSEGIYVIDCQNQTLFIERSRILGTLVLTNWGHGSGIRSGPIHWSPAVKGYPALLVSKEYSSDDNFTIASTREGLSEKALGVNFNPTGAPYGSLGEDSDMDDTFPSEIQGLILIGDDVSFTGDTVIRGTVLSNDDLDQVTGTLRIEYDPDVILHTPPGFEGPIRLTAPNGAAARAVN